MIKKKSSLFLPFLSCKSFLCSSFLGRVSPASPTSGPDKRGKKEKDPQHFPPTPKKAHELVENEQTNEHHSQLITKRTHRHTEQQEHSTLFFSFFEILVTIIPRHERYKCNGLSPGVVTVEWSSLRWLSETGALLSNRLVSSAVIYYRSISQCGRRRRTRGGKLGRGVTEMETGTTTTLRK